MGYWKNFLFIFSFAVLFGLFFAGEASAKEMYVCQSPAADESTAAFTHQETCDANCSTSSCVSHTVSDGILSAYVCKTDRTIIAEDIGACALLCSGSMSGQSSCAQIQISTALPPQAPPGGDTQPPGGNQPPSGNPPGSQQPPSGITPTPNQGIFEPLVTCGKKGPDDCTLCAAFQMVHRIIQFLFYAIMLPLVAIAFIIGGIILLTAAGNEQQITRGKSIVWNTFLGFLVAFAAWIIIGTIIVNISPGIGGIKYSGLKVNWYQFPDCTPGTKPPPELFSGGGGGGTTEPPGDEDDDDTTPPPPGGNCPLGTGSCSPEDLKAPFGDNANAASRICWAESSGRPSECNNSAQCDGKTVVCGLFQINISANPIGGMACNEMFTSNFTTTPGRPPCHFKTDAECKTASGDQFSTCAAFYNACIIAAKNPATNIQAAQSLSNNGTNWGKWVTKACGFN